MGKEHPIVVVLAGPNGAGKSTAAPAVLLETLSVTEFVNADDIARGLSAFAPERVAVEAGRIMLKRVHSLADQRSDFAFETTLASRSFAPWLASLRRVGYLFRLTYVWTNDPELSIRRVAGRVRAGGHHVPDDVVRRRWTRSLRNFFDLYQPIADVWSFYDNSDPENLQKVATGGSNAATRVIETGIWAKIQTEHDNNEDD